VTTIAALVCAVTLAASGTPATSVAPDLDIQRKIDAVPAARSPQELDAALAPLRKIEVRVLVPQLVLYSSQQTDTRAAMAPGVIRERLGISHRELVEALLPLLSTKEPRVRVQLDNWLAGVDGGGDGWRDFTTFGIVLASRADDPPLGLVRYMYDADPDAAAATLAEIYVQPTQRQTLADARDPVARALAQQRAGRIDPAQIAAARTSLAALSRHPEWWMRVYAAAALTRMPELRTPELVAPLAAVAHPWVREMAPTMR
jgi:hypothetical protein